MGPCSPSLTASKTERIFTEITAATIPFPHSRRWFCYMMLTLLCVVFLFLMWWESTQWTVNKFKRCMADGLHTVFSSLSWDLGVGRKRSTGQQKRQNNSQTHQTGCRQWRGAQPGNTVLYRWLSCICVVLHISGSGIVTCGLLAGRTAQENIITNKQSQCLSVKRHLTHSIIAL